MPRCEVAAYVASSAWDALTSEVNVHTATFQGHGARWNLGRVTCRFSALVGSATASYTPVRCLSGTTAFMFDLG